MLPPNMRLRAQRCLHCRLHPRCVLSLSTCLLWLRLRIKVSQHAALPKSIFSLWINHMLFTITSPRTRVAHKPKMSVNILRNSLLPHRASGVSPPSVHLLDTPLTTSTTRSRAEPPCPKRGNVAQPVVFTVVVLPHPIPRNDEQCVSRYMCVVLLLRRFCSAGTGSVVVYYLLGSCT